jgi:hypothetical protein
MTTDGTVDPYDLEALRVDPSADVSTEKILLTVPVRRPKRTEYFRVHPEETFCLDTFVFVRQDSLDRDTYLVAPGLRDQLVGDTHKVRLFTCISKHQVVFLWPARWPDEAAGGAGLSWHKSGFEVAELAKKDWVRMVGNRELGAYEPIRARGELGDPAWPAGKTFRDLLRLAFPADRFIDTPYHPVIRELAGEL